MSVNRVEISGNLTRDAELRTTGGGYPVLSFSMAVNDRRKNQQTGEWEDRPNYVDCTLFGTRAEKLAPHFTKGTKLFVAGKLNYSSWEKDGQRRSKLDVVVDDFDFGGSRGGGQQQGGYTPPNHAYAMNRPQQPTPQPQADADVYADDIPF